MAILNKQPLKDSATKHVKIAGVVLVALALRPALVSVGPTLSTIQHYFGLSHASASLLISIPDLLMGLLALPTPWLVNKIGRNNMIIGSLVLLTASTFLRSYAPSLLVLLLCTAGVGVGIAIAGTLLSGFIKANFPTKAAVMMGIYAMSLSLGSTIAAVSTGPILVAGQSWRLAIGVWTLPALLGTAIWLWVTYQERKSVHSKAQTAIQHRIPYKRAIAWRIALFFACVNFIFYSLLAWTAPLFVEHGFSASRAGLILGCFTFFFMLSSPLFGLLSKSRDRRKLLAASSIITLLGLLSMAILPAIMPFLVVATMAFGLGGAFTLGMTLPLDNTEHPDETNTWTAFILTVGYLVAAGGPVLLGLLRDLTGGFSAPMLTLVGVAAVMLLLAGQLKPVELNDTQTGADRLVQDRELLP